MKDGDVEPLCDLPQVVGVLAHEADPPDGDDDPGTVPGTALDGCAHLGQLGRERARLGNDAQRSHLQLISSHGKLHKKIQNDFLLFPTKILEKKFLKILKDEKAPSSNLLLSDSDWTSGWRGRILIG